MLPYSRKNRCKDSVFLNSTSRITNYYGIYFQETDRIPGFWSLFAGIDAIYNIRKVITACSPAGTFATRCFNAGLCLTRQFIAGVAGFPPPLSGVLTPAIGTETSHPGVETPGYAWG